MDGRKRKVQYNINFHKLATEEEDTAQFQQLLNACISVCILKGHKGSRILDTLSAVMILQYPEMMQ